MKLTPNRHPLVLFALEWLYLPRNRKHRVGFYWAPGLARDSSRVCPLTLLHFGICSHQFAWQSLAALAACSSDEKEELLVQKIRENTLTKAVKPLWK